MAVMIRGDRARSGWVARRRSLRRGLSPTGGVLGACLVIVALSAPAASAYRLGGEKWPGHRITYHNAFPREAKVVRAAVRAWNHSGVHLRFVATSRRRAEVIIHRMPRDFFPTVNVPGYGKVNTDSDGLATLGRVSKSSWGSSPSGKYTYRGANVWLQPVRRARGLDAASMISVAAHELGHVLGLNHQRRTCALMNPDAGSRLCHAPHPWDGRCRVLTADDVRGAIARYGGHLRKQGPLFCQVAAPPLQPTDVTASAADDSSGYPSVTLSWTNSPGVSPPVNTPWNPSAARGRPTVWAYIVTGRLGSCPPPNATPAGNADAEDGAEAGKPSSTTVYPDSPGDWCFSVRDLDVFQRSGPAATVWVNVPSPPDPGPYDSAAAGG
jgi:matrixin